jgi:hypothetical protein
MNIEPVSISTLIRQVKAATMKKALRHADSAAAIGEPGDFELLALDSFKTRPPYNDEVETIPA